MSPKNGAKRPKSINLFSTRGYLFRYQEFMKIISNKRWLFSCVYLQWEGSLFWWCRLSLLVITVINVTYDSHELYQVCHLINCGPIQTPEECLFKVNLQIMARKLATTIIHGEAWHMSGRHWPTHFGQNVQIGNWIQVYHRDDVYISHKSLKGRLHKLNWSIFANYILLLALNLLIKT